MQNVEGKRKREKDPINQDIEVYDKIRKIASESMKPLIKDGGELILNKFIADMDDKFLIPADEYFAAKEASASSKVFMT